MLKKMLLIGSLLASLVLITGCEEDDDIVIVDEVPATPQGVYSITGDGEVFLYWSGPYEADIDGYAIYRSFEENTGYVEIDYVPAIANPNLDLIYYEYVDDGALNGETYFYAVTTVDNIGQESELSAETVFDTPRPQGTATIYDMAIQPNQSGLLLDTIPAIVAFDNPFADIYIDSDVNGVLYINAANINVDLQDMGYTESIYDINWAPTMGWSENGWAELIEGHTYVIWDDDLFFAKIRVDLKGSTGVSVTWAFQLVNDYPELVAGKYSAQKPVHDDSYLQREITSNSL